MKYALLFIVFLLFCQRLFAQEFLNVSSEITDPMPKEVAFWNKLITIYKNDPQDNFAKYFFNKQIKKVRRTYETIKYSTTQPEKKLTASEFIFEVDSKDLFVPNFRVYYELGEIFSANYSGGITGTFYTGTIQFTQLTMYQGESNEAKILRTEICHSSEYNSYPDKSITQVWLNEKPIYVTSPPVQGIITAPSGLTVRKSPSVNGESLKTIKKDEIIFINKITSEKATIDGKSDFWLEIEDEQLESDGFVFGGFVNRNAFRVISNSGLQVRKEPSVQSTALKHLNYSEVVFVENETVKKETIDGHEGYWYKVLIESYDQKMERKILEGYVFGYYCEKIK